MPNYCKKENGKVKITNEEWHKLANYLDVPFDDIYEEDEAKFYINMENQNGDNIGNYAGNKVQEELISQLLDYIKLLKTEIKDLEQEPQTLRNK